MNYFVDYFDYTKFNSVRVYQDIRTTFKYLESLTIEDALKETWLITCKTPDFLGESHIIFVHDINVIAVTPYETLLDFLLEYNIQFRFR